MFTRTRLQTRGGTSTSANTKRGESLEPRIQKASALEILLQHFINKSNYSKSLASFLSFVALLPLLFPHLSFVYELFFLGLRAVSCLPYNGCC